MSVFVGINDEVAAETTSCLQSANDLLSDM
jgi:hypothetical protein